MAKDPGPLEKVIENNVREYAIKKGCLTRKFTSPAQRSVPDRIFYPPEDSARAILCYGPMWIEFKRKGEKPTAQQEHEITQMLRRGLTVHVCDNIEEGRRLVDAFCA